MRSPVDAGILHISGPDPRRGDPETHLGHQLIPHVVLTSRGLVPNDFDHAGQHQEVVGAFHCSNGGGSDTDDKGLTWLRLTISVAVIARLATRVLGALLFMG